MSEQERSGWRDEAISRRHRQWGFNCPAVDIDFLLIEYDTAKCCALVEYKNERATPQKPSHPTYRAIRDLGDKAELPFFAVRHASDFSWWRVHPLNAKAREFLPIAQEMTEPEYVEFLYFIRGRIAPTQIPKDHPQPITQPLADDDYNW